MNRKNRFMLSVAAAAITAATLSLAAFAASDPHELHHSDMSKDEERSGHMHGVDPLIEEMLALDGVFRDVVSAVALGDGQRVHGAIEKMHGTMEKTHEGVRHGTVTLKKNADRLNEFVEQDKQFHGKLEGLDRAARKNDSAAMLSLTKKLLDGCVRCHRDFRKS